MTIRTIHLATALALALTALGTQAAPAAAGSGIEATTLEAVVVTPTARYTASQWQARLASRNAVTLERVIVTPTARYTVAEWQARSTPALAAVMLEPVIVTPSGRYTLAQWQQRQAGLAYVKLEERRGMQGWLRMVWKHFSFARTPIEV